MRRRGHQGDHMECLTSHAGAAWPNPQPEHQGGEQHPEPKVQALIDSMAEGVPSSPAPTPTCDCAAEDYAGMHSVDCASVQEKPKIGTQDAETPSTPSSPAPTPAVGGLTCSDSFMDNGLRWHMLSAISINGDLVEVLAATCIDGIGVIVRWVLTDSQWTTEAIDTEGCEWAPVDFTEDGNEIPPQPPKVWDDVSFRPAPSPATPSPDAETQTPETDAEWNSYFDSRGEHLTLGQWKNLAVKMCHRGQDIERRLRTAEAQRDEALTQLTRVLDGGDQLRAEVERLTRERDALKESLKQAQEGIRVLTIGATPTDIKTK